LGKALPVPGTTRLEFHHCDSPVGTTNSRSDLVSMTSTELYSETVKRSIPLFN